MTCFRVAAPRWRGMAFVVAACVLAWTAPAGANSEVRAVMRGWKREMKAGVAMLSGRATFDAAAMQRALDRYATDATGLASRIAGHSADAQDIRARFVAFGGEARALSARAGDVASVPAGMRRLAGACRGCHDLYR